MPDNAHGGTLADSSPADTSRGWSDVISFCNIHVRAARYLSSFHCSEEIQFFLWAPANEKWNEKQIPWKYPEKNVSMTQYINIYLAAAISGQIPLILDTIDLK